LRIEGLDGALELAPGAAGAAVAARDRCLQPVAQRALVAGEPVELVMPDRSGGSEKGVAPDAGQVGEQLVGRGRIGDGLAVGLEPDRALVTAECLLERAGSRAVLEVVLLELDAHPGPVLVARIPRAHPVHVAGSGGHAPGEGQLERPLDGRFAGLVRAPDHGHARGERQVQIGMASEVAQLETGDPHRVSSAPDSRSRPRRRASRSSFAPASSSAASSSAIWASRSRTNDPRTVSGEASGPSGRGEIALSRTRSLRNLSWSSFSTSSTRTS